MNSIFSKSQSAQIYIYTIIISCLLCPVSGLPTEMGTRPDVLFIIIDDLNDWNSLLDPDSPIVTPNLKRLASRGTLFTRAYCVSPACNPSRVAAITGLRPFESGVYGNRTDWKAAIPEGSTLFHHFQKHGYYTCGAGKVFHHHLDGAFHDPSAFHDFLPLRRQSYPPEKLNQAPEYGSRNTDWGAWPPDPHDALDYQTVQYTIQSLLNPPDNKPMFLACGLFKPHSPFFAPQDSFSEIGPVSPPPKRHDDLDDIPSGATRILKSKAWFWNGMQKLNERIPGSWTDFIRAYAACVHYTDSNIGQILDALDRSPRGKKTVVVLWSDHGFHLGEKNHIEKFALWEKSTRVPLIFIVPGFGNVGSVCSVPVDLSALFPTLAEICGLPAPSDINGASLMPLLKNPESSWSLPAIMTYGRGNHAIRTKRWRFINYSDGTCELYDHTVDPHEWHNLAASPEAASIIKDLSSWLPTQESEPVSDLTSPKRKPLK